MLQQSHGCASQPLGLDVVASKPRQSGQPSQGVTLPKPVADGAPAHECPFPGVLGVLDAAGQVALVRMPLQQIRQLHGVKPGGEAQRTGVLPGRSAMCAPARPPGAQRNQRAPAPPRRRRHPRHDGRAGSGRGSWLGAPATPPACAGEGRRGDRAVQHVRSRGGQARGATRPHLSARAASRRRHIRRDAPPLARVTAASSQGSTGAVTTAAASRTCRAGVDSRVARASTASRTVAGISNPRAAVPSTVVSRAAITSVT